MSSTLRKVSHTKGLLAYQTEPKEAGAFQLFFHPLWKVSHLWWFWAELQIATMGPRQGFLCASFMFKRAHTRCLIRKGSSVSLVASCPTLWEGLQGNLPPGWNCVSFVSPFSAAQLGNKWEYLLGWPSFQNVGVMASENAARRELLTWLPWWQGYVSSAYHLRMTANNWLHFH